MRNDRVALVQHANQYELVHQACLDFAERCGKTVNIVDANELAQPATVLQADSVER